VAASGCFLLLWLVRLLWLLWLLRLRQLFWPQQLLEAGLVNKLEL
jgi:hypothetical protein